MITTNDEKEGENIHKKFICEICDFSCCKKCNYDKHLTTRKHINNDASLHKKSEIEQYKKYKCECGKEYNHRQGLYTHKKKCSTNEESSNHISGASISGASISGASISGANSSEPTTDASHNVIQLLIDENKEFKNENKEFKNMIMELVKSNNELQKQMIDVCLKIQPGNTTISNSHNNNKTFNLQFFLNEECKDALNMSEFINSIELKISDLENIGKLGYVEGMSNIIIRELNDTDMYKRPVHCSDAKRETVYVKEENKWEKDNSETKQMVKAVRGIDKKNYQLLTSWKDMDPKCVDSKSNQCDKYMKIMSKVMDGDIENVNKVIKKIAKEVVIDKS